MIANAHNGVLIWRGGAVALVIVFCVASIHFDFRASPLVRDLSIGSLKLRTSNQFQPPRYNETPVCTFAIVCGRGETDAVKEMLPLLKSILLLSSCSIRFIFFTEKESANTIHRLFEHYLSASKKPLQVDIWSITEDSILAFSSALDYNAHYHHSGVWGTTKLMIPWIVRNDPTIERLVVVDTDMVFVDDPSILFQYEFEQDSAWYYKMPLANRSRASEICSCIVLMNIPHILSSNMFPDGFQHALANNPSWKNDEGLYDAPHGDQGLYFAILQTQPGVIESLPDRWNADRCHEYNGGGLEPMSTQGVSVLHDNCADDQTFGRAHNFFQFYIDYHWSWLRADEGRGYSVKISNETFEWGN